MINFNTNKINIVIAGAGAFGTALANALCENSKLSVRLLSIEKHVVDNINMDSKNEQYFPNIILSPKLKATTNNSILEKADFLFLAVPSSVLIPYINQLKQYISNNTCIINLAKGFGDNGVIISEYLSENFNNPIASMKGASFAIEIIHRLPTGFTFASNNNSLFEKISEITETTNIHLDFSEDIIGVELLSILKNIYAIILGVIDAHFDSNNTRFLVSTKAFNEMRKALKLFGGQEETIFRYCGFGDYNLTSLNDLSRNRTMGLFIGKGFIKDLVSDSIVLEGKRSLNIFYQKLKDENIVKYPENSFPILFELYKLMNREYDQRKFIYNIINKA
ncbi:MAG: NAD(P)H-dependent glycerol-3-phosphate dehydrogenase [Bacteroidales bacterium]|jgi:glycerol-3-phosphate dehydrogenase (NAD(P)+)